MSSKGVQPGQVVVCEVENLGRLENWVEEQAGRQPQPLQVTRNSNGHPIVISGGKEYMQCS